MGIRVLLQCQPNLTVSIVIVHMTPCCILMRSELGFKLIRVLPCKEASTQVKVQKLKRDHESDSSTRDLGGVWEQGI